MSDVYHLLILFFLITSTESFSSNECFLDCKNSTLCEQSCPDGLFYHISSNTMTINVTSCQIGNTNRTSILISPTFLNSQMITTDRFVTNTFETDKSTMKHQEKPTTMDYSTIDDDTTKNILTSSFGNIVETTIFSNTLETPSLTLFEIENMTESIITLNFESKVDTTLFSKTLETYSLSLFENISSNSQNLEGSRITGYISSIFNFSETDITFSSDIVFSDSSTKILEPFHTITYHLCVEKCPDGYYSNETNERCISCRDVCKNCRVSESLHINCACNITHNLTEICSDVNIKSSTTSVTILLVVIVSVLVFFGVIAIVVKYVLRKRRRLKRTNSNMSDPSIELSSIIEHSQLDKDTSESGLTLTEQEQSDLKSRSRYIPDPTSNKQTNTHSRKEGSYDYAQKRSLNPPYDDAHGEHGNLYATARSLGTPARIENTSYINSTAIRLCTISEKSFYINIQHPKGNETKLTSISSAFDFETKYKCISHVDSTQQNTKLAELNQKRLNNSYEKNEVDLVSSQMTTTCDLKCSTSESEHSKCSNSKEELDSIYDNCDYTDTDSLNSHVDNQSEQTSYNDGSSKSVKDYENVTCYGSQKVFKSSIVRTRMDRLETVEHTSDQDRSSNSSEDYEIVESNDTVSCNSLVDDQLEQNSDQDRSSESSEDYEKVKNNDSGSSNSLGNDQLGQTADKVRSSKSSKDYEKVDNYETFATLDVICDGMNLLCFVDRRLQMKYHQRLQIPTSSSNETVNEIFFSFDECSNTYNIQSEYLIISSLMKHQYDQHLDQDILLLAVENKLACVCRWLLSHFHYEDECIFQVLSKSFEIGNNDIIKALAWKITRQFYKKFKVILDKKAIDIYPAFKCECHNILTRSEEKCLRASNKLIAIEWNGNNLPKIPSTFLNFEVKFFSFDEFSSHNEEDEMKDIMAAIRKTIGLSSYNLSMQKKINGEEASIVFKQHRNLSLICPTIIKSKNYGSDHNLLQMHCIQLFCHRKGYIPLGENHFPSTINGLPTDILQGYGFFASTTLRIGDKIGNKTTCGTLGGFYRFGGKLKCFLTCAHVLYSLSTLLAPKDDMCQNEEVDVFLDPVQSSPRVCGSAIRGVFKHDDSSRTSVDAGIVMIESPDFIIDPSDILRVINGPPQSPSVLGISSTLPFVNQNFCDHTMLCCTRETVSVMAPGAVTGIKQNVTFDLQTDKDVNFQNIGQINVHANGSTFQPLLIAQPAHMQLPVGSLNEKRIFTMYNQMVMNIPLQEGDSGTCIYITGNTPLNTGCVGMAIAFCSGSGYSLVTPIKEIIRAING
ncbi:serine-rich adhesin for platelets-like isoform X3 [Mytilus edulis]|uniref:serine-rich adhesin for platelets-like isoform X3 n=1 Tax=Mytilus edulis TaxID=6550 RepID=UPI0039EFEB36